MSAHRRGAPARAPRRALALAAALLALLGAASPAGADAPAARGEYVFRAAGCGGCHTDSDNGGAFLAGGRRFETPFGAFFSPNITPHPRDGIGGWSEAEFLRALKLGLSPAGEHYYPVFPYTSYARMTRQDVLDLRAYLLQVEPVARRNTPHEPLWPLSFRPLLFFWKLLFFDGADFAVSARHDRQWNRGAYLVEALAHCGECHTPRNPLGAPRADRHLAGTRAGPEGKAVPNITPERETGIGRWRPAAIVRYLRSGATPQGDYAGGLMADVIDEGTRHLGDADLEAIAVYLLSLDPVENRVRRERDAGEKPAWE